MNVNKIKDPNIIFNILWIVGDWNNYFSKDMEIKKTSREQPKRLKESVINPNISKNGLLERRETLHLFALSLLYLGLILMVSFTLILGITGFIKSNLELSTMAIAIPFYFIGSSLIMSIRCHIADLDYLRYKRMEKKDNLINFKINDHAEPKIYDLVPGLLLPIIYYNFAIFTINL